MIIDKLKAEGVLVLMHDYRSGSFKDLSGNGNDGTPNDNPTLNREGWENSSTRSRVTVSDSAELQLTEGTLVCFGSFDSKSTTFLMQKRDAGGTNYQFTITSSQSRLYDGANTLSINKTFSNTKYVAINMSNGEIPELFKDGLSVGSFSGAVALSADDADLQLGNRYDAADGTVLGTSGAYLIINRQLTATEHAQLYAYLDSLKWATKTYEQAIVNTGVNLSDTTLLGSWDKIVDNSLIDLSSLDNDGTLVNNIGQEKWLGGNALVFDGNNYIDLGDIAEFDSLDSYTISFWMKAPSSSGTQRIFSKGTGGQYSWTITLDSIGRVSVSMFTSAGTSYSTSTANAVDDDTWHHVVATLNKTSGTEIFVDGVSKDTAGVSGTWGQNTTADVRIGSLATSQKYTGSLSVLSYYSGNKSSDWVLQEYKRGANAVQYKLDWGCNESVANVTSGELENSGWTVDSGTWKVSMDTIKGQDVKVFECVDAGVLSIPINQFMTSTEGAYGSWEWWWYKGNTSTRPDIGINASEVAALSGGTQTTYYLRLTTGETFRLTKNIAGSETLLRDFGAIEFEQWQKFKITRDTSGLFTAYIDDFVADTVTDTAITSGKYIVLDFDAGDKIAIADKTGNHAFIKKLGIV